VAPQQAAVVKLRRDLDQAVVRTKRASALSVPIFDDLRPRKRVSDFAANAVSA